MYSKVLVPLDGSKTAENVLPLARCFARSLQIPVELLAVVDLAEIGRHLAADQASMIRTLVDDTTRRSAIIWNELQKFSCRPSAMPGSARKCGRSDY